MLAARNTGLPDRRNIRAAASSPAVAPTTASTTRMIASAVRIATDACSATSCCKPFASGSQPPVSCTRNRRPTQFASYDTRSRVTPGTSCTTASRRPRMRLTNVDLPTFGRPTTATTGGGPLPSISSATSESASSQSPSSTQVPSASEALIAAHPASQAPPGGRAPQAPTCRWCRPPAHRRRRAAVTPGGSSRGDHGAARRPAPLRSHHQGR